jgi:hypothetical protein
MTDNDDDDDDDDGGVCICSVPLLSLSLDNLE